MPDTVVFVLGYRARKSLEEGSFTSLAAAAKRIDARLVYLDNYSRDGSIEYMRDHYPEVDILMSPRNLMYCQGINVGLQYIFNRYQPDYYILSDADNLVEETAFQALRQRALDDPAAGIVQPLVLSRQQKGTFYSCGHRYDEHHFCRPMAALPEDLAELDNLPSCSILSTLFRREVFEKCGLLEPLFDIYYESSDISFRAREAGYRCVCERRALAYHEGNPGLDYNSYHLQYYVNRNLLIFWALHDSARFANVEQRQTERLRELQSRYNASEFGIEPLDEAIRTGILDGLRVAGTLSASSRNLPTLSGYQRGMPILLRSGCERGIGNQ